MKKPFLLTASEGYYPGDGTSDWIGCFETREEAEDQIVVISGERCNDNFKFTFKNNNRTVNGWYSIIDLRDWAE